MRRVTPLPPAGTPWEDLPAVADREAPDADVLAPSLGAADLVLCRGRGRDGFWRVFWWSRSLGRRVRSLDGRVFLSLKSVPRLESLPVAWDRADEVETRPCDRCGTVGPTQQHHWAPFSRFGDDANSWPTAYLCQSCHALWHRVMTPEFHGGGHV